MDTTDTTPCCHNLGLFITHHVYELYKVINDDVYITYETHTLQYARPLLNTAWIKYEKCDLQKA